MAELATHAQKLTLKELFQAAQQDDFKVVDDYLQVVLHEEQGGAGGKPDQPTGVMMLVEPKSRNTLLHYACDNGNLDACKYLLMYEGMAAAFLNEPNAFGHTPLFYAANSGKLPLVKWLISNGADIDVDYSDRSDVAPRDGDHGIFTPLQIAAFHGHEEVVNFLVECNAELSGTRRNGKSALHFACAQNHKRIVKILLEAGADAHATDCDGKSPVDAAHSSLLSLLLPNEHGGAENDDEDDIEAHGDAADDDDDEDDGFSSARAATQAIRSSFGTDIARDFRNKSWKARVKSINNATLCFQSVAGAKNAFKLFVGACQMIAVALQDPVSQVASCCCTSLLKVAFNAVMSESEFHGAEFHRQHPEIQQIATGLLNRGAGSNEKDASEAVASLLFLICKSTDLTRYLTSQISQIMLHGTVTPSISTTMTPDKNAEPSASGGAVPWRLQLVSIKILNTIASQYRLDQASSGLSFPDAIKISMHALDNSSVHVRTASIDLLVQCLLIRCEESEMVGSLDEIYEQMKRWSESIFKQQNQPLKPSIQAKINNGLKNALQKSKRLSNLSNAPPSSIPKERESEPQHRPKTGSMRLADMPTPALSPRSKSAQKEDDLPYAEPLQDQYKDEASVVQNHFGEKVTRCLFSNAWAPRVEALSFLQYQIQSRQLAFDAKPSTLLLEAFQKTLFQALQDRVNSVFEAGVALLMEVIIALNSALTSPIKNESFTAKDFVRPLIPRLLTKLGDSKSRLHVTTEDALLLLSRQENTIGATFLLEEIIACDRNASPQSLSGTYLSNKMGLISKLLLEFGLQESPNGTNGALPIKHVLQTTLQVCEHKDQNVRQVSLQIVADALQMDRSATMPFLDALARSSRQKIISKLVEKGVLESDLLMDEVDDFDLPSELARPGTGGIRPLTASGSSTKHRPALSNTSISVTPSTAGNNATSNSLSTALPYGTALTSDQAEQYTPIIQVFGEELVRCLLDKAWAQREAAIREIERQVICTANGKFPPEKSLPKTVETLLILSHALELGLNDSVARVFQCTLRLFQIIATDFLPQMNSSDESMNKILQNVVGLVLQKLGDTKQRLRSDCFTLLHSLAAMPHIGHGCLCRMLVDKYVELIAASTSIASSPLVIGELLRLFTILIKEVPANAPIASRADLGAILKLILPAFENKHVDVRNAAIATYAAIYEVTNGGTNELYGEDLDLHGFVAQTKPAIREAITKSVVQFSKSLPSARGTDDSGSSNGPEIDSARQPLALDINKLSAICSPDITKLLTSSTAFQRCQGVEALMEFMGKKKPQVSDLKGAWEICCLLTKQLLMDGTPCACMSGLQLLQLLVEPTQSSAMDAYAIPWSEWGVHLILGSTIRSVVQQSANESIRVRSRVKQLLQLVAARSAVGKNAVCNALLSAPEQSELSPEKTSKRVRKITMCKLRWQFKLRLDLVYEFILADNGNSTGSSTSQAQSSRRSSSSKTGSSSKGHSEPLGIENVVPLLGSCATHPSPTVRSSARKILNFLKSTREEDVEKFIRTGCSPALQRRLQTLAAEAEGAELGNNADHFHAEDATCVRGSRASHVRRIAALRPPRSVPVEETKLVVDVFPPPHSAPGKSRRTDAGDNDDDDSMNDGYSKGATEPEMQRETPIWLDQLARKPSGEVDSLGLGGGVGTAGLVKMRQKSFSRTSSNNGEEISDQRVASRTNQFFEMSSSGDEDDGDYVPEEAPEDEEDDERTDASSVVNDRSVSTDTRVSANWEAINESTLVSKASANKTAKLLSGLTKRSTYKNKTKKRKLHEFVCPVLSVDAKKSRKDIVEVAGAGSGSVDQVVKFAGEEYSVPQTRAEASKAKASGPKALDQVLASLDGPKKVSTMEKTSIDWDKFKEHEGIEDELKQYTKDGYIEKQEFLQRLDVKRFEIEKAERDRQRSLQQQTEK